MTGFAGSTPETRELAQKVHDFLVENELGVKHDQSDWFSDVSITWDDDFNFCGTSMCAAGATVYLAEGEQGVKECLNLDGIDFRSEATKLLGLEQGSWQAHELFFDMAEPRVLEKLLCLANNDKVKYESLCDYSV